MNKTKMNMWVAAFACALVAGVLAETLVSPDGRVACEVAVREGRPVAEVSFAGRRAFTATLGVCRHGSVSKAEFGQPKTVRGSWKPVWGFRKTYPENYVEREVRLTFGKHPVPQETLVVRCYDEGFAVRSRLVMEPYASTHFGGERTSWSFPSGAEGWGITGGEGTFAEAALPLERMEAGRDYMFPFTLRVPEVGYASIFEAHAVAYPRSFLRAEKGVLRPRFAVGVKEGRGIATTPWRAVALAATPGELIERAYFVENLNPPCALPDVSWIKPGFCVSDQSNFELRNAEIRTAADHAVRLGAKYVQIDWGWYGTEYPWTDDDRAFYLGKYPELAKDATWAANTKADPFIVAHGTVPYHPYWSYGGRTGVDLDIPATVAYLKARGLGLCLYVQASALETYDLDELFSTYEKWGVAGLKPGFVGYGSQASTDFIRRLAATAAKHRLWLDIHDAHLPDGIERTYPNLMTTEGGGGEEGDHPVQQDVALPFTRCLVGPFDYTPCLFRSGRAKATKLHKLALFLALPGPTAIMRGSIVDVVRNDPDAVDFLKALPWTYDATWVRDAEVARHLAVVREKDGIFHVAALTGAAAHTTRLALDFLAPDQAYEAVCLEDDPASTSDPKGYRRVVRTVRKGDALAFAMCAAGGFCATIRPVRPRAAYVFSDWSGRTFEDEFDAAFKATGCAATKFENVRLPELTEKLDAFDLVVAGSVANYTHAVDFGPLAAKWRAWLEKGGVLVVADANYGTTLGGWVGALGADCACGPVPCSAHTKRTPASRVVTARPDPLLHLGRNLKARLLERDGHWCHLVKLGAAWAKPILCADGAPLFAYRELGKGGIVLTTAASLKRSPVAEALLSNVLAWRRLRGEDVSVRAFEPDAVKTDDARRGCRLVVACGERARGRMTATFSWRSSAGTGRVETASVPAADGTRVFAPELKAVLRGTVDYALDVDLEGRRIASFVWNEQVPAALDVRLVRKHLYPGDALEVRSSLRPQPLGRDRLLGVEWAVDGGAWRRRPAEDGAWTVPLAGLARGRHELRTRLAYADDFAPRMDAALDWGAERAAEFFVHGEPKYRMRADHVLLENGKPFLPLGFYSVSWSMSDAERLKMVEDVASWGYNTVHVGMRSEEAKTDGYGAFLDACGKLGVRVITEFDAALAAKTVERYRGKSAVMAWNPGDEPAPKGLTPETMFGRYDRFKQLDPDHLAYTVICVPAQYANYAAGTDVLAPDPYPVPRSSIAQIYTRFKDAKAAADAVDTALWCVGQAFGGQRYDKNGPWPRCPTPDEFRGMSYLALMAGAKGIVYYVYSDGSFKLLDAPELLAAAKTFPAELRTVTPFVLEGRCEMTTEGEGGVYAAVWTRGKERLFTAVNTRAEASEAVVPGTRVRTLHGEAKNGEVRDGRTHVRLGPLARVVLALD